MLTKLEFASLLERDGTLILDGGLATELENQGHDLNHPLWSGKLLHDDPAAIENAYLAYFNAGANVVITASYQASVPGLMQHLDINAATATDLVRRSVQLAHNARTAAAASPSGMGFAKERTRLIAGSVGPYGAYLSDGSEYRGDYSSTPIEFRDFHRERIQALVDAGVDLLAIETMPQMQEIEAVLALLKDEFSGATAWLSCTLRDDGHLSDGTPLRDLIKLVHEHEERVLAVGVNCVPITSVSKALNQLQRLIAESGSEPIDITLVCYPNSGDVWDASTKTWHAADAASGNLASLATEWRAKGARLIGGCCKMGPEDVRVIAQALQ